jgi:hypothetical protein
MLAALSSGRHVASSIKQPRTSSDHLRQAMNKEYFLSRVIPRAWCIDDEHALRRQGAELMWLQN